jgi:hypothetical protein
MGVFLNREEELRITSCTRDFGKSCLHTTFQLVINGTNQGFWFVFHTEAFWKGHILASYPRFLSAMVLSDLSSMRRALPILCFLCDFSVPIFLDILLPLLYI